MPLEQLINVVIVVGFSCYVVANELPTTRKITRMIALGIALIFAQFVFNNVFGLAEIRIVRTTTKDILLLKEFSFKRIKGVSVNCFGVSCLHTQLPPDPARSGVSGVVKQQ